MTILRRAGAPIVLLLAASLLALALNACGSSHTTDAGADAGADSAADSGADSAVDSGADTAVDTGTDAGGPCTALTEAECIGESTCSPLYDDFCCPICVPLGACADCARPQMYRCASVAEACETTSCGGGLSCTSEGPDCRRANVVAGYRCDVPGCVARIEVGCVDDCPTECVPVTGDSCTSSCRAPEPACPDGMTAERDGFCYTGFCFAASACQPAQPLAP